MSVLLPLYLLGLCGLLLPWILHRFSHHEPPVQPFPSTQFLEATAPPATSKRKIKHWPLLLLRLLFLSLLCFLFAQPWLQDREANTPAAQLQLVVMDTSLSMRAADKWSLAKEQLQDTLQNLPTDDAVQLFGFANQLQQLSEPVTDRSALSAAIGALTPGYESADYGELMRRLNKIASDADLPVFATFITDAQRSNLPQQMNTLLAGKLAGLNIVPVSSGPLANYYLSAEARTADSLTARVSVRVGQSNNADDVDQSMSNKSVQVISQDEVLASQNVVLGNNESVTVQFESINLPVNFNSELTVAFANTDELPEDDSMLVPVRGLNVTEYHFVNTTENASAARTQTSVFVSTALEANGDFKVTPHTELNAAISSSSLHSIVVVDDIQNPPEAIQRFVEAGGNVLLIPGARTASNTDTVSLTGSSVAQIDMAHELGLGDINWFETRFFDNQAIKTNDSDRVLISLDSGVPLLVLQQNAAGGNLIILNDPLDGYVSDLPLQPAFVTLMQSIAEFFDASSALPYRLAVGQTLSLPANVQLLSPEGDTMLTLAQVGQSNDIRLTEPGLYSVLGSQSADPVLVHIDTTESVLAPMSQTDINGWEKRHDAQAIEERQLANNANVSETTLALPDAETASRVFWRILLPLMLVFLVIESLTGNRYLSVRRDGL